MGVCALLALQMMALEEGLPSPCTRFHKVYCATTESGSFVQGQEAVSSMQASSAHTEFQI